ncbi:uncharacterized protein LOC121380958 [Gigantopelta aegis]|uniref:uncharacterized protein LOC121380958 n=1 Tax=Gigantopelta aegis TaxID=1735272 RepID=UPI001B8891D3|nr:uncharacterized protein LOC121380958 [Gigantopelta aegis]
MSSKMRNIILAFIVLLNVAVTVNSECDVNGAENCRTELKMALPNAVSNVVKSCAAQMSFMSCLTMVDCSSHDIYGPLKLEAIKSTNILCDNGGPMMVASVSTMFLALLAKIFM